MSLFQPLQTLVTWYRGISPRINKRSIPKRGSTLLPTSLSQSGHRNLRQVWRGGYLCPPNGTGEEWGKRAYREQHERDGQEGSQYTYDKIAELCSCFCPFHEHMSQKYKQNIQTLRKFWQRRVLWLSLLFGLICQFVSVCWHQAQQWQSEQRPPRDGPRASRAPQGCLADVPILKHHGGKQTGRGPVKSPCCDDNTRDQVLLCHTFHSTSWKSRNNY